MLGIENKAGTVPASQGLSLQLPNHVSVAVVRIAVVLGQEAIFVAQTALEYNLDP